MGSMSNPNPWAPYDSYNDCSQGICNIYCPQWCYLIFPPPPPALFLNDDDDNDSSNFSPLLIALIGILVSAFVLVSYYTLISKYCHHRRETSSQAPGLDRGVVFSSERQGVSNVTAGDGLNDSMIKSITVYKYRKGDGFVDGSDCSVCLSEFEEYESLRLLPKCNHAFHLPCIDTWLKSHSNCPLCRAFVITQADSVANQLSSVHQIIATESGTPEITSNQHQTGGSAVVIEDLEIGSRNTNGRLQSQPPEEERDAKDEGTLPIRRSVSLNSGTVVSIADVLREIEDEDGDKESGVGTSERREERENEYGDGKTMTAANQGSGVSNFLVRNTVAMKRSVSTGRFIFSRKYLRKNLSISDSNDYLDHNALPASCPPLNSPPINTKGLQCRRRC